MDHLAENPKYYSMLAKLEGSENKPNPNEPKKPSDDPNAPENKPEGESGKDFPSINLLAKGDEENEKPKRRQRQWSGKFDSSIRHAIPKCHDKARIKCHKVDDPDTGKYVLKCSYIFKCDAKGKMVTYRVAPYDLIQDTEEKYLLKCGDKVYAEHGELKSLPQKCGDMLKDITSKMKPEEKPKEKPEEDDEEENEENEKKTIVNNINVSVDLNSLKSVFDNLEKTEIKINGLADRMDALLSRTTPSLSNADGESGRKAKKNLYAELGKNKSLFGEPQI